MSSLWSDLLHELDPYVAGEQPQEKDLIKLNTNENPYPPSPKVAKAIAEEGTDGFRLYPDPHSKQLRQAAADHYQLSMDNVFVGNGSDEVLAFAFMAFFKQAKPILFPDITYSFYPSYCKLFEIESELVPVQDDFSIDLNDFDKPNGGIILANPNAPTTLALGLDAIESLLKKNTDSVVIVDEAYVDFGAESAASLVSRYPNVLVVQTFSKSRSLAGLRVGMAFGDKALIDGMERVKNSFNAYPIDRIAEISATAALKDVEYTEQCTRRIITTRDWVTAALKELGFEVLNSKANFVMAKPAGGDAERIFNALRDRHIYVRYFNKPRISGYLRITIGTDQEMHMLIDALQAIL